jgi:hypothetical protein
MIDALALGTLALQLGILGALVEGARRRDVAATVNAAVALAVAFLPVVAFRGATDSGTLLFLWVAAAGLLHCLGMLGLYDSVWWWDHLTHTISAALVAAVLYAAVLVTGPHSAVAGRLSLSAGSVAVPSTVAVGVFWELVELAAREVGERFDVEPVLVHYGLRDTLLDLAFNAVGALAVVLFDLRPFVSVLERNPAVVDAALLWSTVVVCVGSLLLAVGVKLGGSW